MLVDLPGVQRPRDALTERMQRQVERSLADADAALFVLNGEQEIGAGDRFIAEALKRAGVPTVTRAEQGRPARPRRARVKALSDAAELGVQGELFPISAKSGDGVGAGRRAARHARCPEGPFMYPPDERSDQSLEIQLAELVREQVLLRTREELPHAVEVEVDEIEEREDGLLVVRARVWAETESQKGILVGAGGRMVRAVGTAARKEIEGLLDRRVHLELNVRVRKGWRRDEGLLDRLGIE